MKYINIAFIYGYVAALLYLGHEQLSVGLICFYLFLNSKFDKLKVDATNKTMEIDDVGKPKS